MQVAHVSLLTTPFTMVSPHTPSAFLVSPQLLTRVSPATASAEGRR